MPIFEYKCEDCGHVTEVLEKSGARKKRTCAKCGGRKMAKIFSAFGLGAGGSSRAASGGSRPAGRSGFA